MVKIFSIIYLLSCFQGIIAQTDSEGQEPLNYGNTLFYTPVRKVSCDNFVNPVPSSFYDIGINQYQYLNGAACGDCISGVIDLTKNGKKKELVFKGRVNNRFSGLYYGDLAIERANTYGDAIWPTKWKYIKCPKVDDGPSPTPNPKPTSNPKPTPKPTPKDSTPAGPTCKNGLMHANKKVCCPKACKVCGNRNCNKNPVGEDKCCFTGIIRLYNRSCDKNPAPCVL